MQRLFLVALLATSASAFAHDVDPFGFEHEHAPGTMTRAEALALARSASPVSIRIDDAGRAVTQPSTKTRAQVVAETQAAARMGLLRAGELGPVEPSAEQAQRIRQAGLRAIGQSVDIE